MRDRRAERRHLVLKEGKVLLSDWILVDCMIRDISPHGARLEFNRKVELPEEFRLRIVSADLTIPATAAWMRRYEVGVRFTGVGRVGAVDDTPKRLRSPRARIARPHSGVRPDLALVLGTIVAGTAS